MSKPEEILYWRLVEALPDHVILPQVSFSRFMKVTCQDRKAYMARFGQISQKTVDYLVCDKAFNIVTAIELDDRSHKTEDDRKRDELFKEAGIRIIRWNVGNMPNAKEIHVVIQEV
ncbi:hypothetical protein MAIT1_00062 [Magnetofaba australis IT-1]|uniref:DUF2726 domain-containing protein n=1 Tax=Magnetofaba australis IT-1 TaxID=1434232 RepID=A0A1Y2K8S7_9PROT|nr:hypothetical protein MAIT1_00062 [Magnetofaba australis IT-1]